ncbi:hypothetical protein BD626DRAFT_260627 [Schizophyllum amplum]|uniref:Uncharacterized protein n=1 Tax=Schizophyllum amplum TaxID=97359 RepID=A0A550CGF5_9AGAR|nr:hypothetical protein BD626DRAFT_260627 [Auriculariopsis ampla]
MLSCEVLWGACCALPTVCRVLMERARTSCSSVGRVVVPGPWACHRARASDRVVVRALPALRAGVLWGALSCEVLECVPESSSGASSCTADGALSCQGARRACVVRGPPARCHRGAHRGASCCSRSSSSASSCESVVVPGSSSSGGAGRAVPTAGRARPSGALCEMVLIGRVSRSSSDASCSSSSPSALSCLSRHSVMPQPYSADALLCRASPRGASSYRVLPRTRVVPESSSDARTSCEVLGRVEGGSSSVERVAEVLDGRACAFSPSACRAGSSASVCCRARPHRTRCRAGVLEGVSCRTRAGHDCGKGRGAREGVEALGVRQGKNLSR